MKYVYVVLFIKKGNIGDSLDLPGYLKKFNETVLRTISILEISEYVHMMYCACPMKYFSPSYGENSFVIIFGMQLVNPEI